MSASPEKSAVSGGFRQSEGFECSTGQQIKAYLDRIDAVDCAYRFKQLAVGTAKTPAPKCPAWSIAQLNVFCHKRGPLIG
jgi:hypothetical protein